jgi:NAD(P)H-hydrate epimerase
MRAQVKVFLLGQADRLGGAAKSNFDIISKMPIEILQVDSIDSVRVDTLHCDAIIDAIFGTGLDREPSGVYREVIELINDSGIEVFSLDIPSGVSGDTGQVAGVAVDSDYTVTYGLPKIGNVLYPGFDLCGKLYVSHISFPPVLQDADSIRVRLNDLVELPEREMDAHKGSCGKALFIAGSTAYLGAPYFSAISFLKSGGGLSYRATPRSIAPFVAGEGSEIVFAPQSETDSGSLSIESKEAILELSKSVDIVVLGPGLSLDTETQDLVRDLAREIDVPLLLDGDGLTAIAADMGVVKARKAPTILTPHAGEMSRIAGVSAGEVGKDRIDVVRKAAGDLNAIVVLKGAHSLIGYPDGSVYINTSGNPGMATAGSGDALTGAVAAMYGLGLPLEEAVRIGVFIHGLAGDLAAGDRGEDGMTAQDIVDFLPDALECYREDFEEVGEDFYETVFVV